MLHKSLKVLPELLLLLLLSSSRVEEEPITLLAEEIMIIEKKNYLVHLNRGNQKRGVMLTLRHHKA